MRGSTGAYSVRTVFQSASSSSAIIIGSDVLTPCPISGFFAMIVTTPSRAMRMYPDSIVVVSSALPSRVLASARSARLTLSISPPPASRLACKKARRPRSGGRMDCGNAQRCARVDRTMATPRRLDCRLSFYFASGRPIVPLSAPVSMSMSMTMPVSMPTLARALIWALITALGLGGCMMQPPRISNPVTQAQARSLIAALLPQQLDDQAGWESDIQASFAALGLMPTEQRVCAVIAVIEQESGFRVDPIIPNLGMIASQEIDRRASSHGVPLLLVHAALELRSPDGRTYAVRIHAAR